jgi:hypothetical protein
MSPLCGLGGIACKTVHGVAQGSKVLAPFLTSIFILVSLLLCKTLEEIVGSSVSI